MQIEFDGFAYKEPDATNVKVTEFNVNLCVRDEIVAFIEKWHYSKDINGIISDYCFKLSNKNEMIGAAIFGKMAMANQWKRFSQNESDVIELRRLCCIDKTPKNTESFFIGAMLRWLKKHTPLKVVVSYADKEYGHQGIIYKASNFQCLGSRSGADVILFDGKSYHDKAIRTKHNGELKPFAIDLKKAIDRGDAVYKKTAGKVTYVYELRRNK